MKCRHCNNELVLPLVDLGTAPPSNAYLTKEDLETTESHYPLRVLVCTECWLVQTEDFANASELFDSEYAYFSSFSTSWLEHSKQYVEQMINQLNLGHNSRVIEVAANDGYLLQYVKEAGIPCIGIEPTTSTATAAKKRGIEIIEEFFGTKLAKTLVAQDKQANLTVANNVLAHVPDINDFVSGFAHLLRPNGVSTFEFPHLLSLIDENQFDTIYHEHFSYLSLNSVDRIFSRNGLSVFDVQELDTHGGSLRVFAQRAESGLRPRTDGVERLLVREQNAGLLSMDCYAGFQDKTEAVKNDFLSFLSQSKLEGKLVAAYGAAAKGNTLMNYAGVGPEDISVVIDRNPAKQNKFMPGSRIPIVDEGWLEMNKPEYILILPWNLKREIIQQLDYSRSWGARFVTVIPNLEISE